MHARTGRGRRKRADAVMRSNKTEKSGHFIARSLSAEPDGSFKRGSTKRSTRARDAPQEQCPTLPADAAPVASRFYSALELSELRAKWLIVRAQCPMRLAQAFVARCAAFAAWHHGGTSTAHAWRVAAPSRCNGSPSLSHVDQRITHRRQCTAQMAPLARRMCAHYDVGQHVNERPGFRVHRRAFLRNRGAHATAVCFRAFTADPSRSSITRRMGVSRAHGTVSLLETRR